LIAPLVVADLNFDNSLLCPLNFTVAFDKFVLKSGWRNNCVKEKKLIHDDFANWWDGVKFTRSNLVDENFLPSLDELLLRNDFKSFSKYGNKVEFAMNSLFVGGSQKKFIRETLMRFQLCIIIVATSSFGAQDVLHHPLNFRPRDGVCFIALVDKLTKDTYGFKDCESSWNVIELPEVISDDPRMKTRIIRALLPFMFPRSTFSVWVDSKLQLQLDPLLLIEEHLVRREAYLAVSENHVRRNIYVESDKLAKMFHSTLSVNESYDNHRSNLLKKCVDSYRIEGFNGEGLPDAGLFLRSHVQEAVTFSLRWTQEILKYPFGRDQISFPYVAWKYRFSGVNLFHKCKYIEAVREVGHVQRNGIQINIYN